MSEAVLNRVAVLLGRANDLFMKVNEAQWEINAVKGRLDSYEDLFNNKFDSQLVQKSIIEAIRERLDMAKIEEVNKKIVEDIHQHMKEFLKGKWDIRDRVADRVKEDVREYLMKELDKEEVGETLRKLIEVNLKPTFDNVLKTFAEDIAHETVNKLVLDAIKEEIETVPKRILRQFGYEVTGDC